MARRDFGGDVVVSVNASWRGRLEFMSGQRLWMSWCDAGGSLGCGLTILAALQIKSEKRYVGAVALEGRGFG
jgi:hypothetical protein